MKYYYYYYFHDYFLIITYFKGEYKYLKMSINYLFQNF